jgi:hypothetical protein
MSAADTKSPQRLASVPAEIRPAERASPADVHARTDEVESLQASIYKSMPPAQRLALAMRMFRQMQSLMDAGLRAEHPEWTDEYRRRIVAERILYARTG